MTLDKFRFARLAARAMEFFGVACGSSVAFRVAMPLGRKVVDADVADYFGSIPYAELLKSVARRGVCASLPNVAA
jgi:hypothetical protein